jgi:hypothetical protein
MGETTMNLQHAPRRDPHSVSVTTRKRGFMGHFFRVIFYIWNALMLFWFVGYILTFKEFLGKADSAASQAGTAVGGVLGIGMIFIVWCVGLIVFGGLMLATRGKLVTTTKHMR